MKKILSSVKSHFKSALYIQYFKQIFFYFSIPCVCFCVIICSLYIAHQSYIQSSSAESTFSHIDKTLTAMFDEIYSKYSIFHSDKSVRHGMFLAKDDFYSAENYNYTSRINELLSYSLSTSNYIDSIYLYSFSSNYVYSLDKSNKTNSNHLSYFQDMYWYTLYTENPTHRQIVNYYNEAYSTDMFSVMYQLDFDNNITGVLVFNIPEEAISELLAIDNAQTVDLLIKASDGKKIYSTFADSFDFDFKSSAQSAKNTLNNKTHISTVSLWDMSLFSKVSFDANSYFLLITALIGMIIVALCIPVFISITLATKFYSSIAKIAAYLQEIETNEAYSENELDYIYAHLISIVKTSKNMEYRIAKNVSDMKQAQLISLQTQLNPHFLFNVLNALSVMNTTHADETKFEILVRNLSNLLSYSLNTSNSTATIHEEIRYAKHFIEIEEIKYQTSFNILWDIPEEFMNALIPKFSFQPIIENSFKHGFNYDFSRDLSITINAGIENGNLAIRITDNGKGMSPDDAEKLNSLMSSGYFPETKKIGVANLNKRIQLIFGGSYGVKIFSKKDRGTTVEITVPPPDFRPLMH